MAAFNVTAISDLGYDEKTSFIDPMEPRYRPKSFNKNDFTARTGDFTDAAIQAKVAFFNSLDAYRNVGAVQSRLAAYWKTASAGSPGSSTSGVSSPSTAGASSSSTSRSLSTATAGSSTLSVSGSVASSMQTASLSTSVRTSSATSRATTVAGSASSSVRASYTLRSTTTRR